MSWLTSVKTILVFVDVVRVKIAQVLTLVVVDVFCVVVAILAKNVRRLDVSCVVLIKTVQHLFVDVHLALPLLLWMLLLPSAATVRHCCC